ncbi:hypothetical protein D3C76_1421190 [compost metagenome]
MFKLAKPKRDGEIIFAVSVAVSSGHCVATTKCRVLVAGSYQPLPLSGSIAAGSIDGVL